MSTLSSIALPLVMLVLATSCTFSGAEEPASDVSTSSSSDSGTAASADRADLPNGEVSAVVGGTPISVSEVERILEQVETEAGHDHGNAASLEHRAALSFLIRLLVLEQAAAAQGIEVVTSDTEELVSDVIPEETLAASGVTPEDLRRGLRASRLSKRLGARLFPDVQAAEGEVQAFHANNSEMFDPSWVINGTILFFDSEAAASAAREDLLDGTDVDAVVDEHQPIEVGPLESVGNDAPLPGPLREAIAETQSGGVTPVVSDEPRVTHTIVLVSERDDVGAVSLEEARPRIEEILVEQKRDQLFWQWFDNQLEAADVRVDPRFGTWSPQRGTVIP